MRRTLPPLNAARAFEAAARNSSFTGAAAELRVSQGAVSRHIGCLEQWLRVKLFTRVHRGVQLTPQGATFYNVTKSALDLLESGAAQLKRSPDENRLRLKLPPTFAMRWLVPRLARFHALHQNVDVQITTSHASADFDREDVDVSIYSWPEPPRGSGYRRLLSEILLPVCAPSLLRRAPALRKPADLDRHVLLCSLNRPVDWPTWVAAAKVDQVDGNRGLKFENAALALQAAVDGLGVMIAQWAFVEDDLQTGRLVAPFKLKVPTSRAYFLATNPDREKPPSLRAFEHWILSEAKATERKLAASMTGFA